MNKTFSWFHKKIKVLKELIILINRYIITYMKENILITGCAGFVGYHLCRSLSKTQYNIFGIDNLNSYYDVKLKKDRLKIIKKFNKKFIFKK